MKHCTGLRNRNRVGRSTYSVKGKKRSADRYGTFDQGKRRTADVIGGRTCTWELSYRD